MAASNLVDNVHFAGLRGSWGREPRLPRASFFIFLFLRKHRVSLLRPGDDVPVYEPELPFPEPDHGHPALPHELVNALPTDGEKFRHLISRQEFFIHDSQFNPPKTKSREHVLTRI